MTPAGHQLSQPEATGRGTGVWSTTWWLIAARWRIATNSLLRGRSWRQTAYVVAAIGLVIIALVALAFSWVFTRAIVELTAPDSGPPSRAADVIVASAMSATLVLSLLVSFTVALATLFLSKDLDLLLAAPIPRRAVFVSKLIGGLLPAHLIIYSLGIVPLLGHGLAMGYDAAYYAALLVALAVLPLIPVAIGSLSVLIIVRRVPAQRLGEIVGLIVMSMTLSIALVAGATNQIQQAGSLTQLLEAWNRIRSPYSPAEWLTRFVTHAARHEWSDALAALALIFVVVLIVWVPLALVAERLYQTGWLHLQSSREQRTQLRHILPWNRLDRASDLARPSGLYGWLSQPTVAVLRKDQRLIPRDLTNMAAVLSPLAVAIFFVLQQVLYPIRLRADQAVAPAVENLLAMFSVMVAVSISGMIMTRFCLTAFSFEGKAYWLIKGSPIRPAELVWGKLLAAYVPYLMLGWGLVFVLMLARAVSDARLDGGPLFMGVVAGFRPDLFAFGCFVIAVVGIGLLSFTLALGASRPNLNWDTPHEMLTPDVGCLSLVGYGAYGAFAGLSLILPAAVATFPVIDHPLVIWLAGLGLGLGLTLAVAVGSMWLALAEVSRIGES